MALEALLFDLDGTMVDTEELHRRAFNQAFVEFELGWDWPAETYEHLLRISGGPDRLTQYIDSLAISDLKKMQLRRLVPGIHREKTRIYGDLIGGNMVRPRSGIKRLMQEAHQAGIRIGVVATSASANAQPLLRSALGHDTASTIKAVVTADLVSKRKPAPDMYLLLLSMLGVPAERCVAFEDSTNGVAASKAAGVVTIATPSRWTRAQDFSAADYRLSDLGEPGALMSTEDYFLLDGASCVGLAQIRRLLEAHASFQQRAAAQH